MASCSGPSHAPPRSTGEPSGRCCVQIRPPTRSRASRTATVFPPWLSRLAAVSPAYPAPTTQTSASTRSGLGPARYSHTDSRPLGAGHPIADHARLPQTLELVRGGDLPEHLGVVLAQGRGRSRDPAIDAREPEGHRRNLVRAGDRVVHGLEQPAVTELRVLHHGP